MAKKRVFGNFDPCNRVSSKIHLAYVVENFARKFLTFRFFAQNCFSWGYDVIKTSFLAILAIFGVKMVLTINLTPVDYILEKNNIAYEIGRASCRERV